MQTFVTDTRENGWGVENLDRKRLVKQLLECRQIMAALVGETKGWVNHPATKMWKGKEHLLSDYVQDVTEEMQIRNYKWENNYKQFMLSLATVYKNDDTFGTFNDDELEKIIYTHRGRLYEKDPIHYAQWSSYSDYKKNVCCDRCNYYWPTHLEN